MVQTQPDKAAHKTREFAFSDEDFNALRVLVKELTGIHLSDQKRELVYERISRRLRALDQQNLTTAFPMKGPLDAIFCRNVVIYFDKDTQRDLFARLARLQQPGAVLFLGHSESLFKVSTDYSLIGKTIYRRV